MADPEHPFGPPRGLVPPDRTEALGPVPSEPPAAAPNAERARELIAQVVATIRGFVRAADAAGAVLLLDQGEHVPPLVVDCPPTGPVTLSEGEDAVQLDPDRLAAEPFPLPDVRPLPPFDVDAVRAEIASPLGGVELLARAVRELSERFPGRTVLTVTFATTDPETPLHLAARPGDPIVLVIGEEPFEMAPGWPS